jgi:hypothetical protein
MNDDPGAQRRLRQHVKKRGGLRRPSTELQLVPQARTVIFGMVELHTS